MDQPPQFDEAFRDQLATLFVWRRDVRRFKTAALPKGTVERLLGAACLAPSVGLSEPWRFVLVESEAKRAVVVENFQTANSEALSAYSGERAKTYARLKLAGLREAPVHLAVFIQPATEQGLSLGRRTMPETLAYSAVAAIQTLWLAARAEGIGLGWVSILDPTRIVRDLEVPPDWTLVGYLCLGYPEHDADGPELEREGWERRRDLSCRIFRR